MIRKQARHSVIWRKLWSTSIMKHEEVCIMLQTASTVERWFKCWNMMIVCGDIMHVVSSLFMPTGITRSSFSDYLCKAVIMALNSKKKPLAPLINCQPCNSIKNLEYKPEYGMIKLEESPSLWLQFFVVHQPFAWNVFYTTRLKFSLVCRLDWKCCIEWIRLQAIGRFEFLLELR